MEKNPLIKLNALGQSLWLDYISRDILESGKLNALIKNDGISGVTSNPTIFQIAVSNGNNYDRTLRMLLKKGIKDPEAVFRALSMQDIADAADVLLPVYEKSKRQDGYVSIEVSPHIAYLADKTVDEARQLFDDLGRENVLIKVPATKEAIPAIEKLTEEGVNINATLLFSVDRYAEVAHAYINGLRKRAEAGLDIDMIFSVASFFISRVDTLVDKKLPESSPLSGRAAVQNAIRAYEISEGIFSSERFRKLKDVMGAKRQKLLWASTGTKNPSYSNIKYVEELTARGTINTLPESTINAYRTSGRPHIAIEGTGVSDEVYFDNLMKSGIDINTITHELERDGVKAFADSYDALLADIEAKLSKIA